MADLLGNLRSNGRPAGHRPPDRTSRALIASAARMKVSDKASRSVIRRRLDWQTQTWDAYDAIGEVKYGTGYQGNAMSRLNLYVGVRPDDPKEDPVPITDEPPADGEDPGPQHVDAQTYRTCVDTLSRLAGQAGGHGELLRELTVNISVAGECWLYGHEDEEAGETWDVRSIDEVVVGAGETIRVTDTPEKGAAQGREVTDDDYLIRVWQRHARYGGLPDSNLRGVLGATEELLLVEQAVRAAARSRLNAGMLLLPSEIEFVSGSNSEGSDADDEDPFLRDLMDAMVTPIQDEGDASAVTPMVVKAAAEYLESIRHIDFTRTIDGTLLERQAAALRRIAQGMNLPVEVITGVADVNHWTAWQIDESTWSAHIEPLAIMIVNALTEGFLLPFLEAAGVADPDRFVVWYDPSRLIARPNLGEAANEAHTRGAISDEAYRRARGFTDDDAPDEVKMSPAVRVALGMVEAAPSLVQSPGLPALIEQIEAALAQPGDGTDPPPDVGPVTDEDEVPIPDMPDGPDDDGIITAAATPRVSADLGRRLRDIDRDLRNRVEAAADAQMRRALERAGAQLRSRASKDRATSEALNGIDNGKVAATLGPALVQGLGVEELDLLEGSFDPLGERFIRWCRAAADATLDAVPNLADDERETVKARLDEQAVDAWAWLRDGLVEQAVELLYDPEPQAPETGEWDDVTVVPFDLVREAVARAGGATDDAATVAAGIEDAATRQAVGIATGVMAKKMLADKGVQTEAYEWDYGPYRRTQSFEPHRRLDGVVFESFTDPVLANREPWPHVRYFMPGDHRGCRCDVTPVLVDAAGRPSPEVPSTVTTPGEELDQGLLKAPADAAAASLRRHPAGGYTHVADDGTGFYVRQLPTNEGRPGAWRIEEQFQGPDGELMARRLGEASTLDEVRRIIGAKLDGRTVELVDRGVRNFDG